MRNFKTLKVWQKGMQIVVEVYSLATMLPSEEKFGLKSQISRAAVSIPSNIAEGCSRSSDIDYAHFLQMSLGSSFELETQCLIIKELGFAADTRLTTTLSLINEEQRMLGTLITKIKSNPKS